MRDLLTRSFWRQAIPLWRVIVIVLVLGTLPGAGAAYVLTLRIQEANESAIKVAQTQVRNGCARTNALRRLLNRRADAVQELQLGLIDFMQGAYLARRDPKSPTHDDRLADRYQRDISRVARVENKQLPIIDCAQAFKFVLAPLTKPAPHTAAVVP